MIEKEEGDEGRTEEKEGPFIPVAGGSSVRARRRSALPVEGRERLVDGHGSVPAPRVASSHPPISPIPNPGASPRPLSRQPIRSLLDPTPLWAGGAQEDRTSHLHYLRHFPPTRGPRPAFPCSCERAPKPSTTGGKTVGARSSCGVRGGDIPVCLRLFCPGPRLSVILIPLRGPPSRRAQSQGAGAEGEGRGWTWAEGRDGGHWTCEKSCAVTEV